MNTAVTRETLMRRLKSDRFTDLVSSPALNQALTAHGRDVWTHLAGHGTAVGMDWAWDNGARFTPSDGQTFLTLALIERTGEDLFEVASWLHEHGATLPPAPPPAALPINDRQFTQDSLWRLVVDKNPQAATWLAAQGVPVGFERVESGVLLSQALRTHKHKALPALETLIEAGADVSARDEHGETVLHALARISVPDPDLVAPFQSLWVALIVAGADGRTPNDAGETPLDLLDPENLAFAVATARAQSAEEIGETGVRRPRNRA